jgi:regulation of enolase protein 1 (concanavalin A-like superfamily)
MPRLLALSLLTAASIALVAAPVPRERDEDRMKRIYGTVIDPDGDCSFKMAGEKLRIRVDGPHFLLRGRWSNPVCVMREVEGDFSAEVRVDCSKPPEWKRPPDVFDTFAYAGLLVWPDEDNELDLARGWRSESLGGRVHVSSHYNQTGRGRVEWFGVRADGSPDGTVTDEKPTRLRITRTRDRFSCSYKSDGGDWVSAGEFDLEFPARVKVGVYVELYAGNGFEADFDQYTVTRPKK